MFERMAAPARASVTAAAAEARRLGTRRLGTEHLLLGILAEGSPTARHAVGVDLETARAAIERADREAMAAIGIDVSAQAATPAGPIPRIPRDRGRISFTAAARAVWAAAVHAAAAEPDRRLRTEHLLAALIAQDPADPAVALLAALGIDPADVRARLREAA